MDKSQHQWGRWWLRTESPRGLAIKLEGKTLVLASLSDLKEESHWLRWKELVIATTPGITTQDLEDLERARKDLIAARLIKP